MSLKPEKGRAWQGAQREEQGIKKPPGRVSGGPGPDSSVSVSHCLQCCFKAFDQLVTLGFRYGLHELIEVAVLGL